MRTRAIIYVSVLLLKVLQVNAQSFDIIKTTPEKDRFNKVFDIFHSKYWHADSVSAFRALAQLNDIAAKLQDKKLGISVYNFKADWYSVNYAYNPHSLYYYDKVIDLCQYNGFQAEQGYYTYRRALYYNTYGKYVLACENYLKAYDLFKSAGFNNIPDISVYLKDISEFYYSLGDFETAKRFLLEALNNGPAHRDQINMTNTIGMIYRSNNEYDNALLYFNKAFNIAKMYKDSVWMGIATGNIGSVYFMRGNFDQALPYIKTDYEQSVKYNQSANAAIALIRLATVNVQRRNFDTAESQLITVAGIIKQPAANYLKQYIDMYALWAEIGEKTGRPLLAFAYQKKYAAAKDSMAKRDNILSVERIRLKWETDKNQAQINQLNAKAKLEAITRNGLAGVLFLLIVITILLYNRQKLIRKRDQAALQLETARADQERDKARLALIDYTDKLRQQADLAESFKAELDDMHEKADPSYQTRLTQLEDVLQAHIMTDRAWLEFKALFDNVYRRFFVNINSRFQNLSETDLRHMALIKLRLSNREMANMLGVTIEGIKKAKQRLRKKIGLPEENNLEETIAGI